MSTSHPPNRWSLHRHTQNPPRLASTPTVFVVGAGMAGLCAARILHATGLAVTVLEARARRGGRTWTDDALGVPCDLGASWIHGADDNPLTDWCGAVGIPLAYTPVGTRRFYDAGQFVRQQDLLRRCWRGTAAATLDLSTQAVRSQLRRRRSEPAVDLGSVVNRIFADERLPLLDRRFLAWMVAVSEGVQGAPAEQIDLAQWYPREANGVNAMPVGGYRRLVAELATDLDIRLQTPVASIAHGAHGVVLHTAAGPMSGDAVVVTVPLGILKTGRLLFDPPLPTEKQDAIARIGYGENAVLNKLFLRFERRFWPDMQERCVVLPETPAERGYFSTWLNLEPLQGQPTLLSFASGRAAADMDRNEDDAAVVGRGLQRLRRLFGTPIPDPVGYQVTRWLSDPWALGSYSYAHVASPEQDRELYAAPVGNRVFFAGEGTTAVDYGTVHAALLTGERAARQVHAALCCAGETTENLAYAAWHRRRRG